MALNRAKTLMDADRLVRQGKLAEAIRHYHALAEDNPRDVNTLNRIGDLYVRLGKAKEATRQFTRIADFYAGDGFHLKAIAMYKKIAKLEPTNFHVYEKLADLYAKQGLTTESRAQYLSVADQCLKSGQSKKAIEIYEKVLALEPDNLKVRLLLADLQGREGKPAKAVEGLLLVAGDLRKRGLNEEALKVLQKASRIQPEDPDVIARTAEIMQAAGKNPEKVVASLESLLEADPGNLDRLRSLAQMYLSLGKERELEKLTAAAGTPEARSALEAAQAEFHVSHGDREQAISRLIAAAEADPTNAAQRLERILELEPTRVDVLEKLAQVWTQAADRNAMISTQERLAKCLVQGGQRDRAARALDRLENLDPGNAVGAKLRAETNAAQGIPSPEPAGKEEAVPSLADLERVVELEPAPEDAAPPEEETLEGLPSAGEEALPWTESSEDGDEEAAQDAAYSEKSVIQEMRGEPAEEEIDEDFLSEHFTEAEVFLKYGLVEKAKEQLQTILGRYPGHLPSWMKLREIHAEEGNKAEVASACLQVAAIHRRKGEEEKAAEFEKEALELGAAAPRAGAGAVVEIADEQAEERHEVTPAAVGPPVLDDELDLDFPEALAPAAPGPIGSDPLEVGAEEGTLSSDLGSLPLAGEEDLTIEIMGEEEAAPHTGSVSEEKISEVDFFIQQGLLEEAGEILETLGHSAPGHPEVQKRLEQLRGLRPATRPAVIPPTRGNLDMDVERAFAKAAPQTAASETVSPPQDEGFFDLASELQAQFAQTVSEDGSSRSGEEVGSREDASLDEIFKAFRQKVDQQVEEGDYETRYNLGIAYKEMGLLDEAIGEFQYASRDPGLFLECCSILGICFREKGMTDLAVKWYRKALESKGQPEEKYQGLRYDLGDLHLERGEFPQALSLFSEVYGANSNYRDVASKIRELRKRVG